MRRLVLFLAILTVLGCSGLSSLIVDNKTSYPATVSIATHETKQRKRPEEKVTYEIPAGQDLETVQWFADPPESMDIEIATNGKTYKRTFTRDQYPPGMAAGTSGGAFFFLEIRDNGLTMRDPTYWDKVRRNPQWELFPFLCLGCPIVVAIIVFFALRRAKPKAPQ